MSTTDENLWLEEVLGDDALAWVEQRNAVTEAALFERDDFTTLRAETLALLDADDRIAFPTRHGEVVHNFWTDGEHPRGLLRRTSWAAYRAGEEEWETILDVGALGESEGESWVFAGSSTRRSDRRRALMALSPGGSDATVTREFDLVDKRFIPEDEGGFVRPLAKGGLTWIDDDTVYVTSDFGDGSLTTSGYARTVRRWRRGTPITDAEIVSEADEDDVLAGVSVSTVPGFEHHTFVRAPDFFTSRTWIVPNGDTTIEPVEIDVPLDAEVWAHERWLFITPRSDFEHGGATYPSGSLLVANLQAFLDGSAAITSLFEPSDTRALAGVASTRNHLVLNVMDDVRSQLEVATAPSASAAGSDDPTEWAVSPLVGAPAAWTLSASAVDGSEHDEVWITSTDFVTPESLSVVNLADDEPAELLRNAPHRFESDDVQIEQHFATSADGTRVPYFVVGAASDLASTDGSRPTLLSAYGGFEVPRVAAYSGVIGQAWLSKGGVYVLANIRGGGEYGPNWHRAGLREKRPRVYEDLEAVATALIERGLTSPERLGVSGGSNGGLLVGNMYVRSPETFGAVVCQVPLLDMQRYHLLLAGASWMAEYGDPDNPDDWAYLEGYSPYHQVSPDRLDDSVTYPPILITTSTRDDRVHPGHARKMAARLEAADKDVTYWENVEGGHGGAADSGQQATMQALIYTFLRDQLMSGDEA